MGVFEPEGELQDSWAAVGEKVDEGVGADAKSPSEELCSSTEDNASESDESVDPVALTLAGADAVERKCSQVQADVMGKRDCCKGAPKMANPAEVWTHQVRMTAHFGHSEDPNRLGCGKPKTDAYKLVSVDPESYWPRCGDCFPDLDK